MGCSTDVMITLTKTEIMNHMLDATGILDSNLIISSADKTILYKDENGYSFIELLKYRSMIRILLYLINSPRLNICNVLLFNNHKRSNELSVTYIAQYLKGVRARRFIMRLEKDLFGFN